MFHPLALGRAFGGVLNGLDRLAKLVPPCFHSLVSGVGETLASHRNKSLVAMSIMVYALWTYHWRAASIRRGGRGPYDDRLGPVRYVQ